MLQAVESELTMVLGEVASALMLENRLRCIIRADDGQCQRTQCTPRQFMRSGNFLEQSSAFGKRISDAGCPDSGALLTCVSAGYCSLERLTGTVCLPGLLASEGRAKWGLNQSIKYRRRPLTAADAYLTVI